MILGVSGGLFWHGRSFLACLADGRVDGGYDFLLSVVAGVLADQRRLLGGLPAARPYHRVLEGGAGPGGEGVSGVAEVVEAKALGHADDLTRLAPLPAKGIAPEGCPLLPHEQQPVRARLGVRRQVPTKLPA